MIAATVFACYVGDPRISDHVLLGSVSQALATDNGRYHVEQMLRLHRPHLLGSI